MPQHAQASGNIDSYVAKQQMAVYNYHESRYEDEDMVDIYSLEWRQRITSWVELFT
jgi:hypothetical protein